MLGKYKKVEALKIHVQSQRNFVIRKRKQVGEVSK